VIKSIYYDQSEILRSIMDLCGIEKFCADLTYGNGKFYQEIPEPDFKFDICPQVPGVITASSSALPVSTGSLKSVVFYPPFLTYGPKATGKW